MTPADLERIARRIQMQLTGHYKKGFGIMPATEPDDNFYDQLWARDAMHASLTYYLGVMPGAFEDSLATLLRHQRNDGALPLRVEREYLLLKIIPGLRSLARPAFTVIEKGLRGRDERPIFTGQDFNGAEDTIPLVLIAAAVYADASANGKTFIANRYQQLMRAYRYFKQKFKTENDGLITLPRDKNDWADSIMRGGKLGLMNVLWAQALKSTHRLGTLYDDRDTANEADHLFQQVYAALFKDIYNRDGAYFRASAGDERIDTVASIVGSIFFLEAEEAARVQDTLRTHVRHSSGLCNFDPPYRANDIYWAFRLIGHGGYHNEYVWPWVMCQNIRVKIKIAKEHADAVVREQYKREALADLADVTELFKKAGGAYEIFFPDTRMPAITWAYRPPRDLLANLATFESARKALYDLGWLTSGLSIAAEA